MLRYFRRSCVALAAVSLLIASAGRAYAEQCAACHPNETSGFANTPMARSLARAGAQPPGAFEHALSHTRFSIENDAAGSVQKLERADETETLTFQYVVGSGEHAFGYLAQVGDHLFQSPLSYYSARKQWDMAPGYEQNAKPDFSRPVTAECVTCHSGQSNPLPDTLNSYETPPFGAMGITCERCHGDTTLHLKNPVPGTVLNPAKLAANARDSICEQCHLAGEVRIPNPGKTVIDFRPGQSLEESYTVYVAAHGPEETVKVISQAEQLALSTCKRKSGDKLWCGTCHDPHQQPAVPVAYFRERCLTCHGQTLRPAHAAETNCIGCHMPKRPAKDGGHTAFTDHRISRQPHEPAGSTAAHALAAWRDPSPQLRDRNLALALVTAGIENHDSAQVIQGYRMLNRLGKETQSDPAVLTALGSILLTAKEAGEAGKIFQQALALRPNYAPYEVNLASALMDAGDRAGGIRHLERAVELDPLLQQAIWLLSKAYRTEGEDARAATLLAKYRSAMGIHETSQK